MSESKVVRLLRREKAREITGDSNAVFYDKQNKGLLPRPIKIGLRSVAWPEHELVRVANARIAGRSDEEIKKLVASIMAERRRADSPVESDVLVGGAA